MHRKSATDGAAAVIQQAATISLVIPVYNEESHIAACLDAIAAQTMRPFEVIVVDNNSTDQTMTIARRYPFVTVVRESHQGVVYARDTGFNAACGDVIGRIDVDTQLAADWIERVQALLSDASVDAITGSVGYYDVPFKRFFARVDGLFRGYIAAHLVRRDEMFLYGGNMAIRRSVWESIRHNTCRYRAFHEDIDLAAHLAHKGVQIVYEPLLRAQVSARRIDSTAADYYPYVFANSRTYAAHGLVGRLYMYPVEICMGIVYFPLRLLYRGYDPQAGRFSFRRAYRRTIARVSPVAETV